MFTQKSIKIFHSVQEIRPFSLFQNLELGKASTDDKCHFAIVSLFFRIRTSAKTQTIPNVIWQSHWLDIVNIRVYAKFHHNILHSSRDSAIITFSEFEARQSLDRRKMSFLNLLGMILSISVFTQKFIKIVHSVQEIGQFSLFQNLALGKASIDDKCHFAIPWPRSCQYQCICKILSKYSKRFKS